MVNIFADSNRARLRYIREDTNAWGVTPLAGKTRELRYTGSTLNANKETATSEEIRADRMVADYIETGARSNGDINIEYSAGSHDDFMESFVYGQWTRPMSFDAVRGRSLEWGSSSVLYVKGQDVTDYFFAGRRIKTDGFMVPANNAYWQISAITFNSGANRTEITVTTTTAVSEAGSAFSSMIDANDVIVMNSTTIAAGTGGEAAFSSGGTNAFASAIAAGQLSVGQKIYVDGLGIEAASITLTAVPDAGGVFTFFDGDKEVSYQFGGNPAPGVLKIEMPGVPGVETCAQALADALNRSRIRGDLSISAGAAVPNSDDTAASIALKNLNRMGAAIRAQPSSGVTVVAFAGGAAAHGVFKIEAMTDDKLTVSPAPATVVAGRPVVIKGSMLRNPSDADDIVPQSYTIETGFEDVNQYWMTDGLRVGSFSYNIASNSILTGSFSFNGRATKRFNASRLGDGNNYEVLETTTTPVANATVNVGAITINGEALTTAVQSITLNGNANLRDQNAVSYKFPAGIGAGRIEVTGSLVAYFANGDLWDKFIDHKTVSVEFSIEDVLGNHYEYTLPAANFTTDTVNPPGGNQDVMENLEFGTKRDAATGCQIQIDRFSSVKATAA